MMLEELVNYSTGTGKSKKKYIYFYTSTPFATAGGPKNLFISSSTHSSDDSSEE